MTDKQIIIDGVDVSGCCQYMHRYMEDYDIDTLDYCRHHFKPCKDVDVKYCYYKQLARKEQECEELKKIINEAKNSKLDLKSFLVGEAVQNEYEQQLDQLKAENESLKESLKMFSSTLDWALKSQVGLYKRQIDSSVPDDWEYEEVLVLVEQYIEKIKQTLTDIKNIAEREVKRAPDGETFARPEIKQILQKISEVENGNK